MTTQKRSRFKSSSTTVTYLTESRARELADEIVRKAIRQQARTVEQHLLDIHERLIKLESKR